MLKTLIKNDFGYDRSLDQAPPDHLFQTCPNQIFIGGYWYVIYKRSWFRSCMGLRLRSRLGNFGKISRDFRKYSSRPGFSVYNLGKMTEIWSRLIFFVYCSLNLNMVIVLLPRKQREKRTRSRISRSRRDLQWTEMDRSGSVGRTIVRQKNSSVRQK